MSIPLEGWSHLLLSAWTIVQSWVGYHNHRLHSIAWRLEFFRLPFLQYLLDFVIVAAYWALALAAEGTPTTPGGGAEPALEAPSAGPESTLLAVILLLYFLWDWIEIRIAESEKYPDPDKVAAAPPAELTPRSWWRRLGRWEHRSQQRLYAHAARPMRLVSGVSFLVFLGLSGLVWLVDPSETTWLVLIDGGYIALLWAYRVAHRLAQYNAFERLPSRRSS